MGRSCVHRNSTRLWEQVTAMRDCMLCLEGLPLSAYGFDNRYNDWLSPSCSRCESRLSHPAGSGIRSHAITPGTV